MRNVALGMIAAGLMIGTAAAQTAGTGSAVGTDTGTVGRSTAGSDRAAAGGDSNQAVATTHANATQPAKGSNSFTESQARGRLQDNGFSNVSGLKKDDDGIWRGSAQKGGRSVSVWLDYKGNAGTD